MKNRQSSDSVVITPRHGLTAEVCSQHPLDGGHANEPLPLCRSTRFVSLVLGILVLMFIALATTFGVLLSSGNKDSDGSAATATTDISTGGDAEHFTPTYSSATASTISSSTVPDEMAVEATTAVTSTSNTHTTSTNFAEITRTSTPNEDGISTTTTTVNCHGGAAIGCVIVLDERDIFITGIDSCSLKIVAGPSSGVAEFEYPGIRYHPALDMQADSDEFTYEVCDQESICTTAIVHVQITNRWSEGKGWPLEPCWASGGCMVSFACVDPAVVYEDTAVIVTDGVVHFFSYTDEQFELVGAIAYPYKHFPVDGLTIAMSNDVVALGVPDESLGLGAVYIYEWNASGTWAQTSIIYPDGHDCPEDITRYFGKAIAMDENTLIVGAMKYDGKHGWDGELWRGPFYAYRRIGTTWVQEAELATCFDTDCGGISMMWYRASYSVSLKGNLAIIVVEGSMFAYEFDPASTSWNQREVRLESVDDADDAGNFLECDDIEDVFVFLDKALLIKCTGQRSIGLHFFVPDGEAYRFAQEVSWLDAPNNALAVDENTLAFEQKDSIHVLQREDDVWVEVATISIPKEDFLDDSDYRVDDDVRHLSISGNKLLFSSHKTAYFYTLPSFGASVEEKDISATSTASTAPFQTSSEASQLNHQVKFEGTLFESDCGPPYIECSCGDGCDIYGLCYNHVHTSENTAILVARRPRLRCYQEQYYPEYCGYGYVDRCGHQHIPDFLDVDLTLASIPNANVSISLYEWQPEPPAPVAVLDAIPSSLHPWCVHTESNNDFITFATDERALIACLKGDVYYYKISDNADEAELLQTFSVEYSGTNSQNIHAVQMAVDGDIMAISVGSYDWGEEEMIASTSSDVFVFSQEDDVWTVLSQVCPPHMKDKFGFGDDIEVLGNRVLVTSLVNVYLYSIDEPSNK